MEQQKDIYQNVTDKIITDLEAGTTSWTLPWAQSKFAGSLPLRSNGIPYQGINILMLWMAGMMNGHASPFWMTFRQAKTIGGSVKKGSKGTKIVYSSPVTKTLKDENGEEVDASYRMLKNYTVFNVEQIEGLPAHFYDQPERKISAKQKVKHLEQFFGNISSDVRHGGDRAFYAYGPNADYIQMPPFEQFSSPEAYYSTLGHEHVHWTGNPNRLDRSFKDKYDHTQAYAFEELVAELGAAFLCATLGITPETREDHAAYIGSWLTVLKEDKRAIFRAASYAQRALEHLGSYQDQVEVAKAS